MQYEQAAGGRRREDLVLSNAVVHVHGAAAAHPSAGRHDPPPRTLAAPTRADADPLRATRFPLRIATTTTTRKLMSWPQGRRKKKKTTKKKKKKRCEHRDACEARRREGVNMDGGGGVYSTEAGLRNGCE